MTKTMIALAVVSFLQLFLCGIILLVMKKRDLLRPFWAVASFLCVQSVMHIIGIPVLFFRRDLGISKLAAYRILFYTSWPGIIAETVFMVLIVYSVYGLVLAPFEPLKKLGTIMFRWVAAVSVAVSLAVAIGPHMFGHIYAINVVCQVQQCASVLTLCLLLFVCFGLRPLGLTFRSRYFGACLGLGIIATVQLVQAAWFQTTGAQSVYSPVYFYSAIGVCIAMAVWMTYFAVPEPQRNMVLLPTTSPYFFWNKLSEALGDSPGYVAIAGFTPDCLSKGEIAALTASSRRQAASVHRELEQIAVNQ